jgi:hypothetical protein
MTRTRSNGAAWAMNVGATTPETNMAKQEKNLIREAIFATDSIKGFKIGWTKEAADLFK